MDPWQEVLQQIRSARHKLSITKQIPWYRGVSKCSYELFPKLFREKTVDYSKLEREIYHRFMYMQYTGNENSWDNLVKLQHFGTPTRLLDWTDSFAIALFFALKGYDDSAYFGEIAQQFGACRTLERGNALVK
jgi:hypothetical protein